MSKSGSAGSADAKSVDESTSPAHAGMVLVVLILVASTANLNLSVANIALPTIATDLDASQTAQNLISVAFSCGLAASVLYLGAVGDRYGRKMMVIIGMSVSIPAALLAGFAPSVGTLVLARLIGGVAAGMAYPTTLSLITALWSGAGRTRAIAMWSGIGGGITSLGPLLAGVLLAYFSWGSVFFITVPLAVVALVMTLRYVPAHVQESTDPVDNLGGLLSVVMVITLILAINFATSSGAGAFVLSMAIVAVAATVAFVIRQRRARFPLFDLHFAGRRTFWVAAIGGLIVFGSLMGALYVGSEFVQNVLGYSTIQAGAAFLPMAAAMVLVAPRSASLVAARGSRFTLMVGFGCLAVGFLIMVALWKESSPYWEVGLAYAFVGAGVGVAGTPSSRSLTGSVPVDRVSMASGTADLQRDLGGSIMQSVMGAFLTIGYAAVFSKMISNAPASDTAGLTSSVENQLKQSYSSAQTVAEQTPQYASQITAAAKESFLAGSTLAYAVGLVAVLIGAAVIWFCYPRKDVETELLAGYNLADSKSTD